MSMSQFNSELKSYAKNGLRTAEEWVSLGREVTTDAKSRIDVTYRGATLGLFAREQTLPKPKRVHPEKI